MSGRVRSSGVVVVSSALAAVGLAAVALAACGGSSSTTSSAAASPAATSGVSDTKAQAIEAADIEVFAAANATGYVVGHPQNVRESEQLLKPLIVANTLQVNQSNSVAGGLITNLLTQLDGTTPGLTTGNGSDEHLDNAAVHRLFLYGLKKPTEVFKPDAQRGIAELARLLAGVGANERVSLAGQQPATTASALIDRDVQSVARYWPDLARRLRAVAASLH
jgi:hypothetical protein